MSFFHQVFFSGFGSPSGTADELPAEEAEDEPRPKVSAERALPLREEPSREVPSSYVGQVDNVMRRSSLLL